MVIIKENKMNEATNLVKTNFTYTNGHLKAAVDIDIIGAVKGLNPSRISRYKLDHLSGDKLIEATVNAMIAYINEVKWLAQDDDFELVTLISKQQQ